MHSICVVPPKLPWLVFWKWTASLFLHRNKEKKIFSQTSLQKTVWSPDADPSATTTLNLFLLILFHATNYCRNYQRS